jgi:hypothetical protein
MSNWVQTANCLLEDQKLISKNTLEPGTSHLQSRETPFTLLSINYKSKEGSLAKVSGFPNDCDNIQLKVIYIVQMKSKNV